MATYLDTSTWARRDAFAHFRQFDIPFFNVCVRLDVARLKAALPALGGGLSLACYFIALRLANRHEPFRLRLEGDRVRVHEVVHGSTTVLRSDGESFFFADLGYTESYAGFMAQASAAIAAARSLRAQFEPKADDVPRIFFTTLPWLHFTSFSHARNFAQGPHRDDSVPRLAFGRADAEGEHLWMPMSVEVHHGLMDGVHVGRYVQDFEAALREPMTWLATPPAAAAPGTPTTA